MILTALPADESLLWTRLCRPRRAQPGSVGPLLGFHHPARAGGYASGKYAVCPMRRTFTVTDIVMVQAAEQGFVGSQRDHERI